jgi:hypothetical protein
MPLDMGVIRDLVNTYYGNLPTPGAPKVALKEYQAYEQAAEAVAGKKVKAQDVGHIHETLTQLGISPSDLQRVWRIAKPVSQRLLGRDPSFDEVAHLKDAHPADFHDYYNAMPHPAYPEVNAGDMAKYAHVAEPIALQHAQRYPAHKELARFVMGNYTADDIKNHYTGDWKSPNTATQGDPNV